MKLLYTLPGGYNYRPYLIDMIEGNHTLIAGTTGSGKSVLLNCIMRSLLLKKFPGSTDTGDNAQFIFIDPKRVELRQYKNLPHTILYADDIASIETALYNVRLIIDRRLQKMVKAGIRKSQESPIYVLIDEIVDLITSNRSKEIIRSISDSISISRACNVFFIICTQAPNRKVLKPEIVLNCNCRVALRCNSEIESRQIIGDGEAALLPLHGVGIVVKDIERYLIDIPLYPESELQDIISEWTAQHKLYNAFRRRYAWIKRS